MARFLKNVACPKCRAKGRDRKGNNLATYDDGTTYCWAGCGAGGKRIARRPVERAERPLAPFSRWSKDLPPHHVENLTEKGLTPVEQGLFLYDYSWDRRIYPVYQGRDLVFYEARSLTAEPKAIQKGDKPIHILGNSGGLVVVEDILSAIKVARHSRAMPLWGSSLHKDWIPFLMGLKLPLTFWLDYDKYKEAVKYANTMKLVGVESRVIRTREDPKDLDNDSISELLQKKT